MSEFNLNRAVAHWRRGLEQRRTFSNDDLDELESHVLDQIDSLIEDGHSPADSFHRATSNFGNSNDVEDEYRKTRWTKARFNGGVVRESLREWEMLSSYARIAFRNLKRHKTYAVINIGGLALGIACCLLILLFVVYETSYDRHNPRADRIHRVTRAWFDESDQLVMELARISVPIAPALEQELPEVERSVRLWQVGATVRFGENRFLERQIFFADSTYFEFFGPTLMRGDASTALTQPNTVVITDAMAGKYFGSADPIGQTLVLFDQVELEVTGVMRPQPPNAHVHPDFVASFATTDPWIDDEQRSHWGMFNNYATYILLADGADPDLVRAKLPAFLRSQYQPENNSHDELRLQALTDIHLRSQLDSEFEPNGSIETVYLLVAVAIFVLLIACFNFVNLATARASYRSREVGVRKVLGAQPRQIMRQFLGEATVFTLISTVLAAGLVALLVQPFGEFTGRELHLAAVDPIRTGLMLLGMVCTVALVAGAYPALFLSRFEPSHVLKNSVGGPWRSRLRSVLVVSQFAISIVLICGMGLVSRQVEFVNTKQLGFDKERLVLLPATESMRSDFETVRRELVSSPFVESVTASNLTPSGSLVDHIGVQAEVGSDMKSVSMPLNPVDHDFVDTYGMEIVAGRTFSKDLASDSVGAYVINEAAARLIGWSTPQEAIGKQFNLEGNSLKQAGSVIGVVKDFHFESLREQISPLVLFIMPSRYRMVTLRIAAGNPEAALAYLEDRWAQYRPEFPFTYSFVDDNFGALYAAEQRLGQMFGYFSLLAIVIACLGLFGLASFVTERRSKEIGIRKALGASIGSIVGTLSKDFLLLVGIAFVLALPVAYGVMKWWLNGFAYNVGFGADLLIGAGLAVAAIAFLTVSYQSVRSALANPIVSLRDE